MGLDITAYRGLTKVDAVFNADGEPIDPETREYREDVTQFYVNPDFPERNGSIEHKSVYNYVDSMGFRAGSYGSYNHWREELARISGWPLTSYERYGKEWPSHAASVFSAESGPFFELICFSDCEGVIGPEASAKLAKDFAQYQPQADLVSDGFFPELYAKWRQAFEMAADNGAVDFH